MVDPDAELARLESLHGEVPVAEASFAVPPLEFERLATADDRGALGGARVLLRRGSALLLVRTVDAPGEWAAPGGERDPGEAHERAAVRAAERETGLDLSLGPLLAACRYTFENEDADESVTGLWTWFGAADAGGRPDPADTVLSAGWFTEIPDDVETTVADAAREWVDGGVDVETGAGGGDESAAADD